MNQTTRMRTVMRTMMRTIVRKLMCPGRTREESDTLEATNADMNESGPQGSAAGEPDDRPKEDGTYSDYWPSSMSQDMYSCRVVLIPCFNSGMRANLDSKQSSKSCYLMQYRPRKQNK